MVLMPHPSPSSKLDLKSEVQVYAVCRKRKNSTRVCSSLFPTPPPGDDYTRDKEVLLMPPTVYQRNLNKSKNKKEEKQKILK